MALFIHIPERLRGEYITLYLQIIRNAPDTNVYVNAFHKLAFGHINVALQDPA